MFWRFGNYANISTIDTILDKPDLTIEELLDESDLIQELKQQNTKLIEYLRDGNVLERLLRYVTAPKVPSTPGVEEATEEEKSDRGVAREGFFTRVRGKSRSKSTSKSELDEDGESKEEKQRMKYAYVACEILSCEIYSISQALIEENKEALAAFWQYVKQPPALDPVQAGYFTKVNEALLDRETAQVLAFLRTIDNIIPDMLQHVDCPMIMDLLLKIISLEKTEGGEGIVDWLQSQNLIPVLLSYLSPEHSASIQTSAGDFLKAIITISANATTQDQSVIGPNELTRQLVSEPCVKSMIGDMLNGGNPLTVGVGIVIEVIRKNNSDYDLENQTGPVPKSSDPIYLGTLLRQFAIHIPMFMELVNNSSNITVTNADGSKTTKKREIKAAFGEKIEPLGFDRFKTCELMAELLHCSNMALLNERGGESEVQKRDAERDRLKAEGKLQPARSPSGNEFGTSVDSSGFHHARAPSDDSPEEIKKLEVQNNTEEDEFEKVTASEITPDEPQEPSEKSKSTTEKIDPESPTASGLTAKVDIMGIEKDTDEVEKSKPTNSSSTEAESPRSKQLTSLLTQQLNEDAEMDDRAASPHPEDKPAPLFAKLKASTGSDVAGNPKTESEASEVTPIEDSSSVKSSLLTDQTGGQGPPYEVDIDGSPVVGDLLKIKFVENQVVPTILDFFFRFPWNNFLHNVVYDIVQQVFNGQMERGYNRSLAIDLFETGRITERIIEGQEASDKAQAETKMRLGYMGHLTLIAEEVLKFTERHPPELLSQTVLDKVMEQPWVVYVEQTLAETRERDNAILGGVRPDVNVGPRQAVLNAVNAASGFGGGNNSSLTAGLGNSVGLDSMELGAGNNAGYSGFGGGSLLSSGFNNSSDEEDEDMEDGEAAEGKEKHQTQLSDADQIVHSPDPADPTGSTPSATSTSTSDNSAIPAPLAVPQSRARRQFAARLAQRKAQMEAEQKLADDDDLDDEEDAQGESGKKEGGGESAEGQGSSDEGKGEGETSKPVGARGPARFSGLFAGDSSDEEEVERGAG